MKKPDNVTQFRKRPIKSSKWKRSNRVPFSIRASSPISSQDKNATLIENDLLLQDETFACIGIHEQLREGGYF